MFNDVDWEDTAIFADVDNRAYKAAECKKPHEDGTACLPSWDGFVYICVHRVLSESV